MEASLCMTIFFVWMNCKSFYFVESTDLFAYFLKPKEKENARECYTGATEPIYHPNVTFFCFTYGHSSPSRDNLKRSNFCLFDIF